MGACLIGRTESILLNTGRTRDIIEAGITVGKCLPTCFTCSIMKYETWLTYMTSEVAGAIKAIRNEK